MTPFETRHIGPADADRQAMLAALGLDTLDQLIDQVVPAAIRLERPLNLPAPRSERDAVADLAGKAAANRVQRCFLGQGYHGTLTPGVILRNILENPAWYTAYTPYQAEIAQGRLEALVVFQTMVQDLTGMAVSGASLLDEGTAAAEAMALCHRAHDGAANAFFVSDRCHPQTIAVVKTRAQPLGFEVIVGDEATFDFATPVFGALVQYPGTDGVVRDPSAFAAKAHANGALLVVATDLLALTLLKPPGELGADVVIGSAQRFGVPMGAGGPHAAFLATTDAHVRKMPGRIIGLSRDAQGNPAYRMALQTREQHIRRQKATSNVCTAQVLLAVMAAMYAVYHGPDGLTAIARATHQRARRFAAAAQGAGYALAGTAFFDTVEAELGARLPEVDARAAAADLLLRHPGGARLSAAFDETTTDGDLADLLAVFGAAAVEPGDDLGIPASLQRSTPFLTADVFHRYRSETEMLRYLYRLQTKDLSLTTAMIPLGSCTMKLNATAEMAPVTWPGFGGIHPFAPEASRRGYDALFTELSAWLSEITGFAACSLQPNAGSQGEYAGLLVIRAYHADRGDRHRNICLIPRSAHGTNPATAVMAGFEVIEVGCDDQGNVDLVDLARQADLHAERLGALMVTYPSTHGVFEEGIREICTIVHARGGQVYLDGANMNALVGLARPGDIGADVCHLNLHKTFCIPHGGGGPGMGPICVAAHLAPFLPGHPEVRVGGEKAIGPVSAAPWGSASILPISWAYIAMMGAEGLANATKNAILSANYVAKRLEGHFDVLYSGKNGLVAHECIVDARPLKEFGIEVDDIAKRLMDYGFHGPTMSWPVAGTLMIEPTESESKFELDRFCDAMISIREEVRAIARGEWPRNDNPLKGAPHTAKAVVASEWKHAYSREIAAFPSTWTRENKFWPTVGRVDNPYGDRNLCTSYTCG